MKPRKPKKQTESRAVKKLRDDFLKFRKAQADNWMSILRLNERIGALEEVNKLANESAFKLKQLRDAKAELEPFKTTIEHINPRKPYINADGSIDWAKVPVDTKVIVSGVGRRYFSHILNGQVFTFDDGKTSWSAMQGAGVGNYWYVADCQLAE
jgi:hypothetical protein